MPVGPVPAFLDQLELSQTSSAAVSNTWMRSATPHGVTHAQSAFGPMPAQSNYRERCILGFGLEVVCGYHCRKMSQMRAGIGSYEAPAEAWGKCSEYPSQRE